MSKISEHRNKVNRVLNYAAEHVCEPLRRDELSDVACLSRHHFSRVFSSYWKEPLFEYIARSRSELAARSLIYLHDKSITDIAYDCGFSSPQNFSKAFSSRYKLPPKSFRRYFCDTELKMNREDHRGHSKFLDVHVENTDPVRVAYVRYIGSYNNNNAQINFNFKLMKNWAKTVGLWGSTKRIIGLCPNNKAITPPNRCIYDVCIPVDHNVLEDELVSIQTIPAGSYAVLKVICEAGTVYQQWQQFIREWLSNSDKTCGLTNNYESYSVSDGIITGPKSGMEIYLRLQIN